MTPLDKFNSFIEDKKIVLTTKFIPFSLSRNSEEKTKSLNWKITISSSTGKYTSDYTKGIGHLPYKKNQFLNLNSYQRKSINDAIDFASETGVAKKLTIVGKDIHFGFGNFEFPTPTIKEVLESLVLDSNVKDYLSFESWASDFGFNTDSRVSEKIYKDCQRTAEGLANVLGCVSEIQKLSDILNEIDNEPTIKKNKP